MEAEVVTVVERLGMKVREVGHGRHILEVAEEDRVRAEDSDIIGGDIVAYTDGRLDPPASAAGGVGSSVGSGRVGRGHSQAGRCVRDKGRGGDS